MIGKYDPQRSHDRPMEDDLVQAELRVKQKPKLRPTPPTKKAEQNLPHDEPGPVAQRAPCTNIFIAIWIGFSRSPFARSLRLFSRPCLPTA
ncbi:MAG: hypothetical protein J0G95_12260 [Rhizobiales bacterium]|nr:hypothetical protein [Hyphomicrobiales bacterium]